MPRKHYEAIDAAGKVWKRSTETRSYTHCIVVHFPAKPPSEYWPHGTPARSRAEWAGRRNLAENVARRYRNMIPPPAGVEVLEAKQV
jgi:hypothetical protein